MIFYLIKGCLCTSQQHDNTKDQGIVSTVVPVCPPCVPKLFSMSPQNQQSHQEKFSYLIISRMGSVEEGDRLAGAEELEWARLTAPVIRRPRRVHCQLCCSTGELKRLVVTARLHSRCGHGAFTMQLLNFQ